jgi:exonuclease SbcD
LNGGAYPAIVYPGSLERIDFGEERDPKGFCWVELARGETRWQFIPVQARPFVTVWADARGADDPTQVVLDEISRQDLTDAVVRVNIRLSAHQESKLREKDVMAALTRQRAGHVAAISKDIERQARARLGGATPEGLAPLELLERYFEAKETEPERMVQLIEYAKWLTKDSGPLDRVDE